MCRFPQMFTSQTGKNVIQVDQYPPLSSSRLPNGGWRLDNPYVFFLQDPDSPPCTDETLLLLQQ